MRLRLLQFIHSTVPGYEIWFSHHPKPAFSVNPDEGKWHFIFPYFKFIELRALESTLPPPKPIIILKIHLFIPFFVCAEPSVNEVSWRSQRERRRWIRACIAL